MCGTDPFLCGTDPFSVEASKVATRFETPELFVLQT